MLIQENRLRSRRDLARIKASRRVFRTTILTVRVVKRADGRAPRAAVVTSRRVSPRAVERNQVTRWVREAFRITLPHVRTGVDILLVPHAPATSYTWRHIQEDLSTLLERADLLEHDP